MTTCATLPSRIIAEQIGHRAFFMMGTWIKLESADKRTLTFDIRGCREFNYISITIDADDTYTVEFAKLIKYVPIRKETVRGVYVEDLRRVIADHTGLALSL